MALLNWNAASARLVASVNRFNAFACMFIQCCGLVSGYLLQSAALRQAYKTTRAPGPMGPSSAPELHGAILGILGTRAAAALHLFGGSMGRRPPRRLQAPAADVCFAAAVPAGDARRGHVPRARRCHRCGRPLHCGRPSRRRPPRPRSTLSSASALRALKILQRESILNNAQCYYIGNHFVPLQRDANRSTVGVAQSTFANFHALSRRGRRCRR